MAVNEKELALVVSVLNKKRMSEETLQAMLGGDPAKFKEVATELRKRVLAKRFRVPSLQGMYWKGVAPVLERSSWTAEQVLAHVKKTPSTCLDLARASKTDMSVMGTMLRRMEADGLVRITAAGRKGYRQWVPVVGRKKPGPLKKPVMRSEKVLSLIRKNQPVSLETMAELMGRGRIYTRERIHKLRRKGKVKIVAVDFSWRYAMPDYKPSPEELGQSILLRCEDVGGDCLKWSGAHTPQGHPLLRHEGNIKRVDVVLWTAVHGKKLREGYTLVRTCETPGCCQHEHHKAVPRAAAMKKAFQENGFDRKEHGRRVAEGMRKSGRGLTPEQVEVIRTSPLSGAEVAKQIGSTKSAVNGVRAGLTHRDYTKGPATAMGQLMEAVCR